MAISYTQEYEQLIIFDFKSDKSNLLTLSKLLDEVTKDLTRVQEFILSKFERIDNLEPILDKLNFIEKEKINLSNYHNTRELHDLLNQIKEQEVSYNDFFISKEAILVFYEKISPCRFIDKQLLRVIKKDGYDLQAKLLRDLNHVTTRPILKYLLELYDIYNELFELQTNLVSEKQRFEDKISTGQHKQLLKEIRQSKEDYQRDTHLLIEGLLKTNGSYYRTIRRQLDEQYNRIIQSKLVKLNELVNKQEDVLIDEKMIINALKETRRKYLRLQRYILM